MKKFKYIFCCDVFIFGFNYYFNYIFVYLYLKHIFDYYNIKIK